MTKSDIVLQECNPNLIEHLCSSIVKEVQRDDFSLIYIREKALVLKSFVDRLMEGR